MDPKDRTAAAEAVLADEERARSPLTKYIETFANFLPYPLGGTLKTFAGLQIHKLGNLEYLQSTLRDDLRDLREHVQKMAEHNEAFYTEEIPGLIVDAFHKSEALRSKTKIKRIANVLVHALKEGPACSADQTEEMMRVATALDDRDVEVLRQIVAAQRAYLQAGKGGLDENAANETWQAKPPSLSGVSKADITSICSKLESFGLIVRVQKRDTMYGIETVGLPFGLLAKGLDFISFALNEAAVS
jgi:hypothetical protein